MDITGMMAPERVVTLSTADKAEALVELARVLAGAPSVADGEAFTEAILEREEIMSTGIGQEFAVPHAKIASVREFAIALGAFPAGMEYGSLDKKPVRLIAMIAAPEGEQYTYLRVLKKVTDVLKLSANRERILALIEAGDKAGAIAPFAEDQPS